MSKSYEMKVVRNATTGVPDAVTAVVEKTLIGGLIDRTINTDSDIVYVGPLSHIGRLVDATLGAVAEHRIKNGFFAVPFVKIG